MPLFPETFSFHLDRHDPYELQLQLEDLWSDPRRLDGAVDAPRLAGSHAAPARGARPATSRRCSTGSTRAVASAGAASVRVHADAVVLARVLARFLREKELETHPETRFARFHLRKLVWRASWVLVRERVGRGAARGVARGAGARARAASRRASPNAS